MGTKARGFSKLISLLKDLWSHGTALASRQQAAEALRAKRYRGARIRPAAFHQCGFELRTPGGWKRLPIVNLSTTGLAFEDRVPRDLAVGQVAVGRFTLQGIEFPLELEVRHRSLGSVGTRFVNAQPELSRELLRLFKKEIAAIAMTEVKPGVLKKEPDGNPRLFLGSDLCELFFVERGGLVMRFYLNFFGNYFEFEKNQLSAGIVFADEPRGKPWLRGSDLVRMEHSQPSAESLELAASFVENIEALPATLRDQILGQLQTSSRSAQSSAFGAAG